MFGGKFSMEKASYNSLPALSLNDTSHNIIIILFCLAESPPIELDELKRKYMTKTNLVMAKHLIGTNYKKLKEFFKARISEHEDLYKR